jgi:hypothetical protein
MNSGRLTDINALARRIRSNPASAQPQDKAALLDVLRLSPGRLALMWDASRLAATIHAHLVGLNDRNNHSNIQFRFFVANEALRALEAVAKLDPAIAAHTIFVAAKQEKTRAAVIRSKRYSWWHRRTPALRTAMRMAR